MKVQIGQRVDIACSAQGTPLPVITWLKGGSAVLGDGAQRVSHPDGTLSISRAVPSDAGVYTCVATNIAGSDDAEIALHVQGDPWHRKMHVWRGGGGSGQPPESRKYDLGESRITFRRFLHHSYDSLINVEGRTIPERNETVFLLNLHPFLYVYFGK